MAFLLVRLFVLGLLLLTLAKGPQAAESSRSPYREGKTEAEQRCYCVFRRHQSPPTSK